ncbi:MAG: hypothetical protein J6X60_07755, partial [Ruminiclostridium sp.]|nr:hypothetical protein [Ruminiclostridium sp.]
EPKYQLTPEELKIEKALRAQKIEVDSRKLLIKDTELEDPDDFLNSLNPYDLGKKSDYTRQIENISASQLSGDTKGVDSETLKRLSLSAFVGNEDTRPIGKIIDGSTRVMPDIEFSSDKKAIDPDKIFEPNDDIKEFVPRSAHDTKEVRKHTPEEERFLENINNTIEKKRLADKRDTGPVTILDSGPFDKIIIPTRNFRVESAGNKVFNSAEIPKSDPEIAEQKLKELSSKRKRRLSNFVLEDISDDEESLYDDSEQDETVDDEAGIWTDLIETQKSLRLRYILLLIVTAVIVLGEVLQKIFIQQKIGLFGNEAGLLDSKSLVIAEMVCGVIGMVLCSSVIFNGISKLFRARADCDSVCAVSCVISLAAAVLNLMDTNDLQQGRAFVYIPAAMLGLLFNSIGKLGMIKRAKKNYRFISSDVSRYYAEVVDGQSEASALTKGVVTELPYLVTMRKTELFTDFLKKSYCEDAAVRASRKLVPVSVVIALIMGLLVYFVPNGYEVNGVKVFDNNIYWAGSV